MARARELGVREVAIPTAGNAGGATAAYAAAAGMTAHMRRARRGATPIPRRDPRTRRRAPPRRRPRRRHRGLVAEGAREHGGILNLKEPYRVEGKKTMGYELFRTAQRPGLPDAIIYPTGGGPGSSGCGSPGMQRLGWIGSERPRRDWSTPWPARPVVRAWEGGAEHAKALDRREWLHIPGCACRAP